MNKKKNPGTWITVMNTKCILSLFIIAPVLTAGCLSYPATYTSIGTVQQFLNDAGSYNDTVTQIEARHAPAMQVRKWNAAVSRSA